MKGENKNFLVNLIGQGLNLIFPLITIPYISRVLGVAGVGIFSYTQSIVSMFCLFAMLGVANYGNRNVSAIRNKKEELRIFASSVFFIQVISCLIILSSYLAFVFLGEGGNKLILLAQAVMLLSCFFDVSWYYYGIECFLVILKANIFSKIMSLILILIFVRDDQDLLQYVLIVSGANLMVHVYLFARAYYWFSCFRVFNSIAKVRLIIDEHLYPMLVLFIPILSYSVYRIMDKMMLGYFSSMYQLACYSNAERILTIPMVFIVTLGTTMLPKMSFVLAKGEDFRDKLRSSIRLSLLLALNMTFGLVYLSDEITSIFFGKEFALASDLIKVLSITITASALSSVIRTHLLIPKGKDRVYVSSTIIAAIINFILNLMLIPIYGAFGACIGTILAEYIIALYQLLSVREDLDIREIWKIFLNNVFKALAMILVVMMTTSWIQNSIVKISIAISMAIPIFLVLNFDFIWHDFFGKKRGMK